MSEKEFDNIGKYISQIYRKGSSYIAKEISKYGIGSGQCMFLLELYKQDGRNQEELSCILKIDKGTTARALKKLEDEGFVMRLKDECDKRSNKIYLTDKGREVELNIYEALKSWDKKITDNFTDEEKELMVKLLDKICINQNIK